MAIALFSEKNYSYNLIYFDWLIKKDSTIQKSRVQRCFLNNIYKATDGGFCSELPGV